jgi:protein-S-isoprenylcysteine O-methyltransferase Ste14
MMAFRIYLLAGLVAHKALWEALRHRPTASAIKPEPLSLQARLVKLIKLAILLAIVVQTLPTIPFVLPISRQPFALHVVGGLIYTLGLFIAMLGRLQLGNNWSDIEVGRVKEDHATVQHGIYAFIRHPIYVGDLLLLAGLELSLNSWLIIAVAVLTPIVLRRAVREEETLRNALPGYDEYARRTKRFIPYVV